jgi:hypothetical protein
MRRKTVGWIACEQTLGGGYVYVLCWGTKFVRSPTGYVMLPLNSGYDVECRKHVAVWPTESDAITAMRAHLGGLADWAGRLFARRVVKVTP